MVHAFLCRLDKGTLPGRVSHAWTNAKPRNASAARPTSPIAKDRDCMQVINKHCALLATAGPQSTQVHSPAIRLHFRTILLHVAGCHSKQFLSGHESAGSLFLSVLSLFVLAVLLPLGSFNSSFAHPPAPACYVDLHPSGALAPSHPLTLSGAPAPGATL
jgi:hypothetical protein